MALNVNTNLGGDVDGDSDIFPDSILPGTANRAISGITVDPKTGDILGPVMDPIIDPNETYDVAVQSLIDDMMTGVRDLGSTSGPGGTTFLTGENGKAIVHPSFQPEADGFMKLGDIKGEFASKHDPLTGLDTGSDNDRWAEPTGTDIKGNDPIVHHVGGTAGPGGTTYFTENIGGTAGPGGTSFLTGYTNGTICEGLDSSTVDVMNNVISSLQPANEFI